MLPLFTSIFREMNIKMFVNGVKANFISFVIFREI